MDDEQLKHLIESNAVETRRHFDVIAEQLKHEIGLVAEGVGVLAERVDRLEAKVDHLEVKMEEGFADLNARVGRFESPSN